MKEISPAAISKYIDGEGNIEILLQSDGKNIQFNIDTGLVPAKINTEDSKPTERIEMSIKTVKYCDTDGTEYEMYIIASDAWKVSSSG